MLVDLAVMLADGGEAIADIDVLRHQGHVFGRVASAPTVWRMLVELTPATLRKVETARARARRHVWAQLAQLPASKVANGDRGEVVVLDVDATLVTAYSDKESAAATFKADTASSNTASDHIDVLTRAIAQTPRRKLVCAVAPRGVRHS